MRIKMFYQSLISDWNHGNAHFLRGVATELMARGHIVDIYEPKNSWSAHNLIKDHGLDPLLEFSDAYPELSSTRYDPRSFDFEAALNDADLVIVHEWNEPELIERIGRCRRYSRKFKLLFHDTHHRLASEERLGFRLHEYDGVLAYGAVITERYLRQGWTNCAWTWHEAADTRVFQPLPEVERKDHLVWVGNWGDEERTAELHEFLIEPARRLRLSGKVYGVRYPASAIDSIQDSGLKYCGWLPNYRVPAAFARAHVTLHIPRAPYTKLLPGIPTIRVFEALACGIPLICSPWDDAEGLFTPGRDYLIAHNGTEMRRHLSAVLQDKFLSQQLALDGLTTILDRHTCSHRVDELMSIHRQLTWADRRQTAIA